MRLLFSWRVAFVALGLVVVLTGCASTKIEATRNPAYSGNIAKIYVIIDHAELESSDAMTIENALTPEISQLLEGRGKTVECQAALPKSSEISLDDPERIDRSKIVSFQPDVVLVVAATGALWAQSGGLINIKTLKGVNYDASLYAEIDDKPVWRARIENKDYGTITEGLRKMGKATARKIIEQLEKDGMIEPPPN